tara:strand:+ start:1284 stop:1523 length:240 start_codon:yes stop_codon:yes gene_type:complete
VLSGNPFILILGLIAVLIFFYLLRIRASRNQIDSFKEPKRMNWSWLWLKYGKNKKESNIIEGQSEEVTEDDERPFDFRD